MSNFNPKYDDNKKMEKYTYMVKILKKMVIIIEKSKSYVILVKHIKKHHIIFNNNQLNLKSKIK